MAKRVKPEVEEEQDVELKIISKPKFDALLRKAKAAETQITSAKGDLGSAVQKSVSDDNLHVDAFRLVRKYLKKDPAAAAIFFQNLHTYWGYAGLQEDDLFSASKKRAKGKKTEGEEAAEAEPVRPHLIHDAGQEAVA